MTVAVAIAARTALDEGSYLVCWQEGYALSRDQAVAAALEDQDPVPARPAPAAAADAFELSARELEVARLVADGLSNPAISAALFVLVATVKTHVSHILAKLGLDSRTRLFISPRTAEYHLHKVFSKLGISSRRQLRHHLVHA